MQKNFDTVEEFWSKSDIAGASEKANEGSLNDFSRKFASFLEVPNSAVNLASSGKSALEGLLSARKDNRPLVMVPALNCVRVKDAIEGAGCTAITYDFMPMPGIFDWDLILKSATNEVGVLIVTHFYGVPVDLREARDFCNEREILLIEDCAQTLGGTIAGRQVGTWGDAAIFSFSYDKPISLGWGGVAVVNSPDKFRFKESSFKLLSFEDQFQEVEIFRNFLKAMEVRRSRIRLGNKNLSSIFRRVYDKWSLAAFYGASMPLGPLQAELGVFCLETFSEAREVRNGNAKALDSLCPLPTWPVMSGDIEPAWLKQKVFVSDPEQLRSISRILQKRGVRAGNFNWPRLIEGQGFQSCKNARQVATCWMDVPIHQRMNVGDIANIVSVLSKCA